MVHQHFYRLHVKPYDEVTKNIRPQHIEVKLVVAEALKTKGNCRFELRDFEGASGHYLHSIGVFRYFPPDSESLRTEEDLVFESVAQREEVAKLIHILFLNLSQCFLETKAFENAFTASDQALRIDDRNPKAYYRQTRALEGIDRVDSVRQAIECLEVGMQFCATESDRQRFEQMRLDLLVRLENKLGLARRVSNAVPKNPSSEDPHHPGKVPLPERLRSQPRARSPARNQRRVT